jgi:hypothetical protein
MAFGQSMGTTVEEPSYLKEMLFSQTNLNVSLIAAAVAGALSFPFGIGGALVVGIAYLSGEAIASMYVPALPTFRVAVDRRVKARRRQEVVDDLTHEISRRDRMKDPNWDVLGHMRERIAFLREIGHNRNIALTEADIDRLEDSCIDFLGLWLSHLSIEEREHAVDDRAVNRRLDDIEQRLAQQPERGDRTSLEKARSDLQEVLKRHQRIGGRKAAVEAAMLSIPDAVEEIYHMVITAPTSGSQADRLQDAINRLHIEETLESSINDELNQTAPRVALRAVVAQRQ